MMFFLSIPTRLVAGYLGDIFAVQPLLGGGMVAAAAAIFCLLVLEGNTAVFLFVVLMAVEQGGSTLNWVALGNYFGRASFATLMGIMSTCFNIGMLISPIYAGLVFDRTGSYNLVLLTFVPLYLSSGYLFLISRRPSPPLTAAATTPASISGL